MAVGAVLLCLSAVALAGASAPQTEAATRAFTERIQNIVYVMFENRAFDHMLGFLKSINPEIDGLNGNEWNPVNATDPHSERVFVSPNAVYVDPDPDHSIGGTTEQIFGVRHAGGSALMDGFVQNGIREMGDKDGRSVMACFNHSSLSVLSSLALDYAVFDHWYASVPGPTFPNRLYATSATSHGFGDNSILQTVFGWPQKSLFSAISESGHTWRTYSKEVPTALLLRDTRTLEAISNMRFYKSFLEDARAGTLPNFSWIDPSYFSSLGVPGDDQHPSHSVAAGEALLKEIYDTLRASPQWNSTLLIVTYDEHGGFHDHQAMPLTGIPNPDGLNATKEHFSFERLGVRIPTVMASPWIKSGTVIHTAAGPTPTSQFDHTSLSATLKDLYGFEGPLTKRDAWAVPFHTALFDANALTTEPRTDSAALADVPPVPADRIAFESQLPVNHLQHDWLSVAFGCHGLEYSPEANLFKTQGDAGEAIRQLVGDFIGQSP